MKKTVNIILGLWMGGILNVYKVLTPELEKEFIVNLITLDGFGIGERIPGVKEIRLDVRVPIKGKNILWFLFRFIRTCRKHRLKLFIVNNRGIAILVYFASLFISGKYFVHQHEPVDKSIPRKMIFSKLLYMFLLKRAYQKAQRVICNSVSVENNVISILKLNNTEVIYSPVKVSAVVNGAYEMLEEEFDGDYFNFVSVGRLAKVKGFDVLIRAVKKIAGKVDKRFRVYIVGGGNERESLEKLVRDLKLREYVFLIGSKKNPYPYIKRCDCYLSTSRWEGFGLTIVYAMILKRPIIASRTGGAKEILTEDNVFFEIEDDNELAEKMLQEIQKGEREDTVLESNYNNALKFDIEIINEKFRKLLREAM